MKKRILILILLALLTGCYNAQRPEMGGIKLDGFSVGLWWLNTDIQTYSTQDLGVLGQYRTKQSTEINEFIPGVFFNFVFVDKKDR